MNTKLKILALFFCTLSSNLYANWQSNFYTDDSPYYLKINRDGFTQRIRVKNTYCSSLREAHLVFKSHVEGKTFQFKRVSAITSNWPKLYGIRETNYCWLQATATGINLNKIDDISYAIKFITRGGKEYYFQGLTKSILPKNRITDKPVTRWIILGQEGSTPVNGGGVFYKVWEPFATQVHLFKNLSPRPVKMIPSHKLKHAARVHIAYVPNSKIGDRYVYKYVKKNRYENLEVGNNNRYSDSKVDPMSYEVSYNAKGGRYNGYLNPYSVVATNHKHTWRHDLRVKKNDQWMIYQLWPLTFNPKKVGGVYKPGTFRSIKEKIPYLKGLGINTVEFLPVHESRFHASWGYAMDSIRLIERNYGTPKQLKELIDALHKENIKVMFDVVINHVNNNLIRDPIDKTVKTSKFYKGDTGWGPKPRFELVMVQKWIMDSLTNLIRDYHLDGFRFDMVEHIYNDDHKAKIFLRELLEVIEIVSPDFYNSAELLPDDVYGTFPRSKNGGLGFHSQWNDKFKNFFELEFDSYRPYRQDLNLYPLKGAMNGFSNHRNGGGEHNFGPAKRTVNYLGSHDFVGNKDPILRLVSDYESYEWDGRNHFFRVRPLEEKTKTREKFRSIHNYFTHNVGKTAYGILFSKPGATLFFQGEELASDINIENEWSYLAAKEGNTIPTKNVSLSRYIKSHRMPWEYLELKDNGPVSFLTADEKNLFKGYHRFFKDMIKFKMGNPAIDLKNAQNVKMHYSNQVISYQLDAGKDQYFVISNFGGKKADAWIHFPGNSLTWWEEIVNTSSKHYGGKSDDHLNIITNLGGRSNNIRLASPATMIFKKQRVAKINKTLYLRGTLNNWAADGAYQLIKSSDRGDFYVVNFNVKEAKEYEFKLGTSDWSIDLGSVPGSSFLKEQDGKGQLSYAPGKANFKASLAAGNYKFIFNLKTFKYNFIKLN